MSEALGDPPDWMADPGKKMWHEMLLELGDKVVSLDRYALTLACAAYAAAEAALQDLNERGPLVEGDRGMVKNPSNQVGREQAAAFKSWCAEFGLTPGARKRLLFQLGKKDDDAEDLIT